MRRKEDEDRIAEKHASRVAAAVGQMTTAEQQSILNKASNMSFSEITDKLREMDKVASKDKWTDQEFKSMVEFSAMLYAFVVMCREFERRFGGKSPFQGVNVNIFKFGGP